MIWFRRWFEKITEAIRVESKATQNVVNQQIDSIRKDREAAEHSQHEAAGVIARAINTASDSASSYEKPQRDKEYRLQFFLIILTFIAAGGAVAAAFFSWRTLGPVKTSADAADTSAKTAKDALTKGQRAFVYFSPDVLGNANINKSAKKLYWIFRVPIQNSGDTPTRRMEDHISAQVFDGEIPDGFAYSDRGNTKSYAVVLGPKQGFYSGPALVDADDAKSVWLGKKHLYLWGWARYKDVFQINSAPPHQTKFCYEVSFGNDPSSIPLIEKRAVGVWGSLCPTHNCADEECDAQK
jgi:hypothetical protein